MILKTISSRETLFFNVAQKSILSAEEPRKNWRVSLFLLFLRWM